MLEIEIYSAKIVFWMQKADDAGRLKNNRFKTTH